MEDEKGGIIYDKSPASGMDYTFGYETGDLPVRLNRERIHDYDPDLSFDDVPFREVGEHLRKTFEASWERGGVPAILKSLDHLEKVCEEGGMFEPSLLLALKELISEGRKVQNRDEWGKFWEKATEFYQSIEMEPRPK